VSVVDCEAMRDELQTLKETLDYVRNELAAANENYNTLWRQNRSLSRRILYESAAERGWKRRAVDYKRSAIDRYMARLTAQRIREERVAPLLAEQEQVINQIWEAIEYRGRLQIGVTGLEREIAELEERYKRLCLFEHVVVTANVETEREGTILVVSITVEYTALISKRDPLITEATRKIYRWFQAKFGNVQAEPSAEFVDPDPDVTRQLRQENADATLLHYDWYWRREGLYASPGEEDSGDIEWTEDIPTVSEADLWGHRKHPDLKRHKKEGGEQSRLM